MKSIFVYFDVQGKKIKNGLTFSRICFIMGRSHKKSEVHHEKRSLSFDQKSDA